MANKCGLVVYTRPCRSTPRYFKCCDVARIAQQCVNDTGESREALMAAVAKQLGFPKVYIADGKVKLFEFLEGQIATIGFVNDGVATRVLLLNGVIRGLATVLPAVLIGTLIAGIVALANFLYKEQAVEVDTVINTKCNCKGFKNGTNKSAKDSKNPSGN